MGGMAENQITSDKLASLGTCMRRIAEDRDKHAFAELFDHYAPRLRAYSLAREPGDELAADELVQEVMTRVWLKAGKYNAGLSNLNTWIFTLARNCRIDSIRRNTRYVTAINPVDIFNEIEDESPGPFHQAQAGRVEESIRAGLAKLPQEQAEVLTKIYLEGKSHRQTSTEMRLPLGTVKSRVRLALKKLKVLVTR